MGSIHAQEAIPATGGDASGSNGTLSYSIGQVVYTAGSSSTGSINQGVQQPYDISTNSIEEESDDISLSIFPNPTKDVLKLTFDKTDISEYKYELYNSQGKLIKQEDINANQVNIPMQNLDAATYFLKVKSSSQIVKSFRVVKQ
ncbi:MAG: T9SS type A sorting domain-containing protein [Brumimicrobium sp.]